MYYHSPFHPDTITFLNSFYIEKKLGRLHTVRIFFRFHISNLMLLYIVIIIKYKHKIYSFVYVAVLELNERVLADGICLWKQQFVW